MTKVIVFGSNTGGVGKTTTAVNLAVYLQHRGDSVCIIRADKNPDVLEWAERREASGLPGILVRDVRGDIEKTVNACARLVEFIIIDCAGHDSAEFRDALLVSDIVITPVKPSSAIERNTLTALTETVRAAQTVNERLVGHVLMARIDRSRPAKVASAIELDKVLRSDDVWLQPLRVRISDLDVFENAFNIGAGVHDVARASSLNQAKGQIELLAKEILLY